jgi:uncharacterized protein (UPF0248 family)
MQLSNAQFDALATLAKLQNTPRREAARYALVYGHRNAEAARRAGVTPHAAHGTTKICKRVLALIDIVKP